MAFAWFRNLFGGTVQQSIGYGTGTALGAALEPLAQDIRNEIWPQRPNVPIPPADLAAMAVQGVMGEDEAAAEALMWGITPARFHRLFRVNGNPIAPEEALELWNRGEISETDVERALVQSRLKPEWVNEFKLLRRQILQSSELANMVVQGVLPESEGVAGAAKLGIAADDFHKLVRLAGNPPGPETTLSLWNRGIMTEADATKALLQSRLKPEWIEQYKESRFHPASAAEAVRGVVRKRIPHDEGARIAAKNGIDRDTFDLMVETAGRPIGIAQALALYNRKVYTRADVEHVVAFSDVRTEFTDAVIHLAVRYPSLFQIRTLVSNGSVTDEQATKLLTDQGFEPWLATAIVHAAHGAATNTEKELTKTEIANLYHGEAISRDDASGMLQDLGYSEDDAAYILDLAEFRRAAKYVEAVITRVHSSFVAHKIGEDLVTTELDTIGVAAAQREQLIDLWTEERKANVRVLTPAQVLAAFKKGIIEEDVARAKLLQLGYDEDDAGILLAEQATSS